MTDESPALAALGETVRRVRRHRRYTQAQVASAAGVSREYVGMIERGQFNPTVDVLLRLLDVMHVLPQDFFFIHEKVRGELEPGRQPFGGHPRIPPRLPER